MHHISANMTPAGIMQAEIHESRSEVIQKVFKLFWANCGLYPIKTILLPLLGSPELGMCIMNEGSMVQNEELHMVRYMYDYEVL